jgi:poly-gamma-glutamate synthesis protein (capsule biosynthesis protein)
MPAPVRRVAAGILLLATTACSADEPSSPSSAPPSSASESTADASPSPSAEPAVTVLVAHQTRGRIEVSARMAQRIERGRVPTWRPLDGTDGRLRVAGSAAAVARDRDAVAFVPAQRMRAGVRPVVVDGEDPLKQPPPGSGPVTRLLVVGDIMLGRGVAASYPTPADAASALRPLAPHLRGADLTVGNLESTLSDDGPALQGDDSFAADPAVAAALARLGVDAVSLANNHTGDYGTAALRDTLRTLRRSPLAAFGAGTDLAAASRPVVLRHRGVSFGFVGFNAIGETPQAAPGTTGALSIRMPPRTGPLDQRDLRHVTDVVRRLDRRVDVVVVVPHWGDQYTHVAWPSQPRVARRLVAAGADLVAGGHPHWVQGLERVGPAVVAHSLGNLVFDMDFMTQTMEGVTLTATFWGDRLVGVDLAPYRMDERFAPRLVRGPVADGILADVWAHSTGPFSVR